MLKSTLKEMITSLTEGERQSLYDSIMQRNAKQPVPGNTPPHYDIAIIGLSGRYPQSEHHYEFWRKLQHGTNFIEEVPARCWDHRNYYQPQAAKSFIPHQTRCKFGAFLKTLDEFDAAFFNLRPDEVVFMDPQERITLEVVWSCIEDAGYVPAKLDRNMGIFSGLTYSEYQKLVPITSHSYVLNNRIAYFFDFHGPAMTVDAGCCSSLTAIHLACQSLIKKECPTAIVAGANVILHPDHYTSASSMLSSSKTPCSNPFGTDDGWIPAEGVVAIFLKPLEQALQDKDRIYAVLKSSHISQEGKTSWFTAFSPKQQARLIQDNFTKSGIHPETIGYVEAAANGSSLGDAIELEGLTTAFDKFTGKKQICPIGSVKSNVGHGEAVSTLLQLTNVLLQFKSKTYTPLINLKEMNPNIKIEDTHFYFQKSAQKWEPFVITVHQKQFALPRRATISSFGAGGNAGHLILEEHRHEIREKHTFDSYFIPLSSKTAAQLRQTIAQYVKFFEEYLTLDSEWESTYSLLNIMFTLCTGRVSFQERVVIIANDLQTLMERLRQFLGGESHPDIISKTGVDAVNAPHPAGEKNQGLIQSWLEKRSWHDLAKFWVQGNKVSWDQFFQSYNVQRLTLPAYCFQKQSFLIPKPAYDGSIPKVAVKTAERNEHVNNNPKPDPTMISVPALGQVEIGLPSMLEIDPKISKVFLEIFAKAINIPSSQIDAAQSLEKYGFDSALVLNIASQLERYFPVVPKTIFFECATIGELIEYFMKQYPDDIQKIVLTNEGITLPEQTIQETSRQVKSQPGLEGIMTDDSIKKLAQAILSNRISADSALKKFQ